MCGAIETIQTYLIYRLIYLMYIFCFLNELYISVSLKKIPVKYMLLTEIKLSRNEFLQTYI